MRYLTPKRAAMLCALLAATQAAAADPGQAWRCETATDAQPRQATVVNGMLPRVVFEGETTPVDIESRMAHYGTPALSVAVIRNGAIDWSAAWGRLQADGEAAGCDSLFQAGSLAKPVALLAAMRMQQAGLVDFDKDVGHYLASYRLPPGRQSATNPVTLRDLFAHTAGITPGGYDGYARDQPMPTDVQTVRAEQPANSRKVEVLEVPGTRLAYSGGGYTVIEIALQDLTGQPFERIAHEWALAPLGMKQADFAQPLHRDKAGQAASGHVADGGRVPGGWHNHPEQAAAGLWATASDMATFLAALHRGLHDGSGPIARDTVHELLAEPIDGHAYGFRMIGEGEDVFLTHYGGTSGYRAGMTINLRTGDGAVYLANSDNGSDLGVEFLGAVSRAYGWPVFRGTTVKRAERPAEQLQSLRGRYRFGDGPVVAVAHEDGALALLFPNGDRYAMTPVEGDAQDFIHAGTGVRASFREDGGGMLMELYGQTGRRESE